MEIERRVEGNAGDAGNRVGNDAAGQRQVARTDGAQVGALNQAELDVDGVVINAGAAAEYGLVVLPGRPGESERGRKMLEIVLLGSEVVRAIEGREPGGLGQ